MENQRDEKLWQLARRRADFQNSLLGFLATTAICWVIWFLTDGHWGGTPWPLWVMLGLGIGLFFKFMKAYKTDKDTLAEKEYDRLKSQQK